MFLLNKAKKWVVNDLITQKQLEDILAFEKKKNGSRLLFGLGGLGILSIILGIGSLIAANWHLIPPEVRIGGHVTLNVLLAFITLKFFDKPGWVRELLVALQAGLVLTFIALIGQTLQTQSDLWVPLSVWLVLATPMLVAFTNFRGTVAIWLVLLFIALTSFSVECMPETFFGVLLTAVAFVLYGLANLIPLGKKLPAWTDTIQRVFFGAMITMTSLATMLWYEDMINVHHHTAQDLLSFQTTLLAAGVGVLVCALLTAAQKEGRISFWSNTSTDFILLLVASLFISGLPVLIPHGETKVASVLAFCLYWLFVGGIGFRMNMEKLWSLSVLLIGLRLFIAYIEIMESLALQGLGFIMTGFVFFFLAWVTRTLMKTPFKWLTPPQDVKEG